MQCLIPMISLGVTALAFLSAVTIGVYSNYRWMERIASMPEQKE